MLFTQLELARKDPRMTFEQAQSRAMELRKSGRTCPSIARDLARSGFKKDNGKPYSSSGIHKLFFYDTSKPKGKRGIKFGVLKKRRPTRKYRTITSTRDKTLTAVDKVLQLDLDPQEKIALAQLIINK